MESSELNLAMSSLQKAAAAAAEGGLARLQAILRGKHAREVHGKRIKEGGLVCPFVVSTPSVVASILELCSSDLQEGGVFYDIGSGDGRVLVSIAEACPNAKCVGIEVDPQLCATARRRVAEAGLEGRIEIIDRELNTEECGKLALHTHSMPETNVVMFCFLVPSFMDALSVDLFEKCSSSTRVVSYKFPLPEIDGWTSVKKVETEDAIVAGGSDKAMMWLYHA